MLVVEEKEGMVAYAGVETVEVVVGACSVVMDAVEGRSRCTPSCPSRCRRRR